MRIAQIAPLHESVPPKLYGGTERVVSYLTEALVKLGHEVTLYASGDSLTSARLRSVCEVALRLDKSSFDPCADHVLLAERVFQDADEFELIHSHIDYLAFSLLRRIRTPRVTTLHGRLDIPNLRHLYCEFSDEPLISISDDQRVPLPWARWQGTVYHGLPVNLHRFHRQPGRYLAFLGRISPEKRVEDAIQIARRTGMPLKIAAKVDKPDREYFESAIKPLFNGGDVEFIGEIGEREKNEFLGHACALLFPIDWPEPFGLVMIEALACGTPVIARARGSVPELIEHGKTGFVFNEIYQAVKAVENLARLKREWCRQQFEERFTSIRMAHDYMALYEQLIHPRRTREIKRGFKARDRATLSAAVGRDGNPQSGTRYGELSANERHHSSPGPILHPG